MTAAGQPGRPAGVRSGRAGPAAIRRHPVACFLAWSFSVGQSIALVPVTAREVYEPELATAPFGLLPQLYPGRQWARRTCWADVVPRDAARDRDRREPTRMSGTAAG